MANCMYDDVTFVQKCSYLLTSMANCMFGDVMFIPKCSHLLISVANWANCILWGCHVHTTAFTSMANYVFGDVMFILKRSHLLTSVANCMYGDVMFMPTSIIICRELHTW